jgi:hypothetical protein
MFELHWKQSDAPKYIAVVQCQGSAVTQALKENLSAF